MHVFGEATWFACNDDAFERGGRRQREGARCFCKVERVRWRAAKDRGFEACEILQASGSGLTACGIGGCAETVRGFEGGPKTEEWTEGKGEEDPVGCGDSERVKTEHPVFEHPVPVGG